MSPRMPYPPQPFVLTPAGPKPLPDGAIDAATAQCLDLTTQEAEGVLTFFGTWLGFEPDTPVQAHPYQWPYAELTGFGLRRPFLLRLLRILKGVEMRELAIFLKDGQRIRFRVGYMLAANAGYIFLANSLPFE